MDLLLCLVSQLGRGKESWKKMTGQKEGSPLKPIISCSSQIHWCCVPKWTITNSSLYSMLPSHLKCPFLLPIQIKAHSFRIQVSHYVKHSSSWVKLTASSIVPAWWLVYLYFCNLLWMACICSHVLLSRWGTPGRQPALFLFVSLAFKTASCYYGHSQSICQRVILQPI